MYLQNCILWSPEKFFFSKKVNFFHVILTRSKIFLDFWLQKMAVCPNFRSMCPEELFEKNIVLQKKRTFFFFKHWAKHVRKMANFLLRSINSKLRDQRSFFGKFSWGSTSYFIYFAPLEKKLGAFVKTAFYERWGSFWRKKDFFRKITFPRFSELDLTIPGLLAKKIWLGGRIAALEEPGRTIWEQCFFEKISSFSDFETKTFGKGQFFSAVFSELQNTWPEKHPEELFSDVSGPILSFLDY